MLDRQGLGGLWREGLLARNVLLGNTNGYRNHPQLERWRTFPIAVLDCYLTVVLHEADRRGYNYNGTKINPNMSHFRRIAVTHGQVAYELQHLKRKLVDRSPNFDCGSLKVSPVFRIVAGDIESWERVTQ